MDILDICDSLETVIKLTRKIDQCIYTGSMFVYFCVCVGSDLSKV